MKNKQSLLAYQYRKNIARFSFLSGLLIFILLQEFILPVILGKGTPYKVAIAIISTFGMYEIVYGIFYRYFERKLVHSYKIAGEWQQVLIVEDTALSLEDRLRRGSCIIECSIDGISVKGTTVKYPTETPSSRWESAFVDFDNKFLAIHYQYGSVVDSTPLKKGFMQFYLANDPPTRLIGKFHDIQPVDNRGEICLFRNKDEADNYITAKLSESADSSEPSNEA